MAAIPPSPLENWSPIGLNFIDMRLCIYHDTSKENNLLTLYTQATKKLTVLYTQYSSIDDQGLYTLTQLSPQLKKLNLNCYNHLSQLTIPIITKFKYITELNLNFAEGSNETARCSITDKEIGMLVSGCPHLEKLDISYALVTSLSFLSLTLLKELKYLRIHACPAIQPESVSIFRKKRPDVFIEESEEDDPTNSYLKLLNYAKEHFLEETHSNNPLERYKIKEQYSNLPIGLAPFNVGYL